MKMQKTWAIVKFYEGESEIEANLNYFSGAYYLTHSNNDRNVTFRSDADGGDVQNAIDRAKCVLAALKFIKSELGLYV